jgi:hypothetical protein
MHRYHYRIAPVAGDRSRSPFLMAARKVNRARVARRQHGERRQGRDASPCRPVVRFKLVNIGVAFSGVHHRTFVSFDHLVGADQQCVRHRQAKRFGGSEINQKLEFGRLLYWQFVWNSALENAINIGCCSSE